ncbi:ankyrin repeat [Fusarium denticulatum]|uniref:Ankyrin repeat n=1 Tax=Fusarium denticulatum TaxID=48507 RepID=A0A8H5TGX3_9HYPO|nr:ankyrin repeat [Fusarium denticulatum]
MTALRAMVRRHLANGINHRDLDPGFELDWFVLSLANPSTAPWLPEVTKSKRAWDYSEIWKNVKIRSHHLWKKLMPDPHTAEAEKTERPKDANSEPAFPIWKIDSGTPGNIQDLDAQTIEEADVRTGSAADEKRFQEISGLANANSILLLRRTMKAKTKFFNADSCDTIGFNVKKTADGWAARADELDAALSLWLYSVSREASQDGDSMSVFPSSDDLWVRGGKVQKRRCLQILGPSTAGLLRDLDWWMPNGLKGILAAQVQRNPRPEEDQEKRFPHMVRAERIACSGKRWPDFDESKMTPSIEDRDAMDREAFGFSWKDLPTFKAKESKQMTRWRWRPTEEVRREIPSRKTAISCPLVVESQDSLERLYARDMFSSFVWALSSHLKPSCVGKTLEATILSSNITETTDTMSLRNEDLSSLAKAIAEQCLWAEHEVYLIFIPPLSATDNLPGVDTVIDLALQAALQPEKEQDWPQAQIPYDWLFDTAMLFPPTSYVYWKSVAILLRLHARITYSEMRSYGSQRDDVYESQDLLKMRARIRSMLYEENQNIVNVRISLEKMFDNHKELKPFPFSTEIGSGPHVWGRLHYMEDWPLIKPNVFNSKVIRGDGLDIFNFTELHHTMRSNLLGNEHTYQQLLDVEDISFRRRFDLQGLLNKYFKDMNSSIERVNMLESDPTYWPEHFSKALIAPAKHCRELLRNGVNVNAPDMDHWTPLHHACHLVISEPQSETTGIEPDVRPNADNTRNPETAMRNFYEDRVMKKAKSLIIQWVSINAKGLDGFTPLHCAAKCGHVGLVDLLIQHGAEIKAPDGNGRTPMHLAAAEDYSELLQKFLNHGFDLNTRDRAGRTPLHLAIMHEATGSIEELTILGADLIVTDSCGRTPLHIAALYNFGDCIDKLLENEEVAGNGGVNVKDDKGRTPLHLAALFNSGKAIKTLLPHHVDGTVAVQDNEGQAPLHLAAMSGAFDAVGILMSKQAKHSWLPIDNNGNTPFHLAAQEGHLDIIETMGELLKKFDLNPSVLLSKTKSDGMGAFSTAVVQRHLSSAWALLDLAAELGHHGKVMLKEQMLEEVDNFNETTLAQVVYREREDDALGLIERGANVNVEWLTSAASEKSGIPMSTIGSQQRYPRRHHERKNHTNSDDDYHGIFRPVVPIEMSHVFGPFWHVNRTTLNQPRNSENGDDDDGEDELSRVTNSL